MFAFGLTNKDRLSRSQASTVLDVVTKMIDEVDLSNKNVSLGALKFDEKATILIDINTRLTKADILSRLSVSNIVSNKYQIEPALQTISDDIMKIDRDQGVAKTMVIFTNEPQDITVAKAIKSLSSKGVKVVAIGVGDRVKQSDISLLAGGKDGLSYILTDKDDMTNSKIKEVITPGTFVNCGR